MSNVKFVKLAKKIVGDWYEKERSKETNTLIDENDICVVWLCKALQNNKALLTTELPDGLLFEVTYDGRRREVYLNVYSKIETMRIVEEEDDQSQN